MRRPHLLPVLHLALLAAVLPAGLAFAEEVLPEGRDFGAGLQLTRTTALQEVLAHPERHHEAPVLLEGRLADLCTRKGCWTVLTDGEATLRVRFEDYGFFLPPDALGARALVEGRTEIRRLSEKEARHIASETRGGDPDAIEGPREELGFVARGVRLLPAPPEER